MKQVRCICNALKIKRMAYVLAASGVMLTPVMVTHAADKTVTTTEPTHANNFGDHVKRDAKAVGATVKEAAHRVGVASKAVAHEIATAAKRGAAATRKAMKGEKVDTTTSDSKR